jgi:hypothetical protein
MSRAELWSRPHIKELDSEEQYHPHLDDRQCHCQSTECMGQQPELPWQERDFELVWLNDLFNCDNMESSLLAQSWNL